jgi:hypothetical protein
LFYTVNPNLGTFWGPCIGKCWNSLLILGLS